MIESLTNDNFTLQVLAFSCTIALGMAFSCFLKILLPSKNKEMKGKRFISFCILLTVSVILYTVLIFECHSLLWFKNFFLSDSNYYKIMIAFFSTGLILSLFWKIAIPAVLVLYFGAGFLTNHIMKSIFKEQSAVIQINVNSQEDADSFSIISCHMPDFLILPVRRNWFFIGEELSIEASKLNENPLVDFYIHNVLLKELSAPQKIPLPQTEIYPILFSARISFIENKVRCTLTRDL
ncbi:MAG: hypothetical protein IJ727_06665 [Treponema sp.]|nr:hypothetical protein [Treponema sp.]